MCLVADIFKENCSYLELISCFLFWYLQNEWWWITFVMAWQQSHHIYEGRSRQVGLWKLSTTSQELMKKIVKCPHILVKKLHWLTTMFCVYSYRLTISGKTCIFQKENDPTVLRYMCNTNLLICDLLVSGFD